MPPLLLRSDPAHNILIPFIQDTEQLMLKALTRFDANASCRIIPAVDLGFPHDVVRIAGGFPTGCYIEWKCETPFIPIDTTVNIDTSTIFELEDDISDQITVELFDKLQADFERSSYVFNFHKGNHFISFGRYRNTLSPVLVIHSNEKEFKYQFNGLMPTEDNWYHKEIKVEQSRDRYIRYIIGSSAELFIDIAKTLEDFNIIRHRFVAHLLTNNRTKILSQRDNHHYYMPDRNSIAIGCFPVQTGSIVPIFSRLGRDIAMFEVSVGGNNVIKKIDEQRDLVLVPHGWGKTCPVGTTFNIDFNAREFTLSGKKYEIRTLVSLGKDDRLELRNFADGDENTPESLYSLMSHHCPGKVVQQIQQVASFSKYGFAFHG